jgi:hypothetical protein
MKPHKQRLSSMFKQRKTENPMGAGKKQALRVTFDRHLKLEFHGSWSHLTPGYWPIGNLMRRWV